MKVKLGFADWSWKVDCETDNHHLGLNHSIPKTFSQISYETVVLKYALLFH